MTDFDETCIFCKIVRGEIPSHNIYEDEMYIAFLDIAPLEPGHTLVVPKTHCTSFVELPDESAHALGMAIAGVSRRLKAVLAPAGFNLMSNSGERAGQVVMHAHFHIVPRAAGDGRLNWHPAESNQEELTKLADKVRRAV